MFREKTVSVFGTEEWGLRCSQYVIPKRRHKSWHDTIAVDVSHKLKVNNVQGDNKVQM